MDPVGHLIADCFAFHWFIMRVVSRNSFTLRLRGIGKLCFVLYFTLPYLYVALVGYVQ